MGKTSVIKKSISITLMVALMVVMLMPFSIKAQAATLPSDQFATPEQLKGFNTAAADSSLKIYFGDNDQEWWIAGSQNDDSLVMVANGPLAINVDTGYPNYYQTRIDPETGQEVYSNHYGSSTVRASLQKAETSYFTTAEQGKMNDTTVYTEDLLNNRVYSTTDKLYLGYGDGPGETYFTVGANSKNDITSGLKVDNSYMKVDEWNYYKHILRRPYYTMDMLNMADKTSIFRMDYAYYNVNPAFELDLSTVLFASAAPAASSDGNEALDDAMTLRYSTDNLGTAKISLDKSKVILSNVPAGTYLVVQNDAGAYTKAVSGTTSVQAADMGLDEFKNCKVWLETTDNAERMTYAAMATNQKEVTLDIIAGKGLEITSKNASQTVGDGDSIQDIEVKVQDGYYLPDGYISDLQKALAGKGLSVTKTEVGFTITGTLNADETIELSAAAPKASNNDKDGSKNGNTVKTGDYNHIIPIAAGAIILALSGAYAVLRRKKS